MAQITVRNADIIEKIATDEGFRRQFLGDTKKLLDDIGYDIDEGTLDAALKQQIGGIQASGGPRTASTIAIITIF